MQNLLITGGTKAIGKAIAEKFAAKGFNIATCSRTLSDLEQMESDFKKQFPAVRFFGALCDVSRKAEIIDFVKKLHEQFGEIHVLVNNAGIFFPGGITTEEDGVFEMQINTNLASAYHFTRALIPEMLEKNKGHIFNMCSTASIIPYINGGSYCISKFALLGFSRVLREETKRSRIRVTSILPGATYTDSWKGSYLSENRFIKVEDVANTVYMCYEASENTVIEEILLRPQEGDIL